jgi:hypothetical protein
MEAERKTRRMSGVIAQCPSYSPGWSAGPRPNRSVSRKMERGEAGLRGTDSRTMSCYICLEEEESK